MFNFRLVLLLMATTFFATFATAQDLELPSKSPRSSTTFSIGYTDITIDYSSPKVNGRDIFGALEKYDEIWRAGANGASTIEFSTEVALGRERAKVPAGKYSIFVIPKEEGAWTVIFNKDTELRGTGDYTEEKDVARIEVEPRKTRSERLKYGIEDQGIDRGYFTLAWADKRLIVFVRNNSLKEMQEKVEAAVEAAADDKAKAGIYANAADVLIYLDNKRGSQALGMINKSIELNPTPQAYWVKAQIHETKKEVAEAIEAAKKAKELGDADSEDRWYGFYKGAIADGIAKWEKMK